MERGRKQGCIKSLILTWGGGCIKYLILTGGGGDLGFWVSASLGDKVAGRETI